MLQIILVFYQNKLRCVITNVSKFFRNSRNLTLCMKDWVLLIRVITNKNSILKLVTLFLKLFLNLILFLY